LWDKEEILEGIVPTEPRAVPSLSGGKLNKASEGRVHFISSSIHASYIVVAGREKMQLPSPSRDQQQGTMNLGDGFLSCVMLTGNKKTILSIWRGWNSKTKQLCWWRHPHWWTEPWTLCHRPASKHSPTHFQEELLGTSVYLILSLDHHITLSFNLHEMILRLDWRILRSLVWRTSEAPSDWRERRGLGFVWLVVERQTSRGW
jgi:hypothetical protein